MFTAAIELAKKDLRIYFRDPIAWLLGFLLPIVLVTIFGFLMGAAWGGSGPAPKVDLYIVDEDDSSRSRQLIKTLKESDMLRVRPREGETSVDRIRIQQRIEDGEISHALIIETGFGEGTLVDGSQPLLRMLRDPGRTMEDQIIRINLMQAMFQAVGGDWWVGSSKILFRDAGAAEDQLELFDQRATAFNAALAAISFADEEGDTESPAENTKDISETTSGDPMNFIAGVLPMETQDFAPPAHPKQATYQIAQAVAGISVMMLMFGVTSCGRTLIQERDRGTMARLLSIGVPRSSLLVGTTIFTVSIGLMQLIVMFVYGEFMFRVGIFSNPLTLLVLALLWVITASSFGILVAVAAKSEKQADMLATLLIISMAALGGCWFPLQMVDLPVAFEMVTRSTATYWAMSGFQGMLWNGLDLLSSRILTCISVQVVYTTIMFTAAVLLFQKRYSRV